MCCWVTSTMVRWSMLQDWWYIYIVYPISPCPSLDVGHWLSSSLYLSNLFRPFNLCSVLCCLNLMFIISLINIFIWKLWRWRIQKLLVSLHRKKICSNVEVFLSIYNNEENTSLGKSRKLFEKVDGVWMCGLCAHVCLLWEELLEMVTCWVLMDRWNEFWRKSNVLFESTIDISVEMESTYIIIIIFPYIPFHTNIVILF